MKTFFLLFLAASLPAAGAELITATITITNTPSGLTSNLTVNGTATRYWTNDITSSPGTLIQQTNNPSNSATQLINHLTAYPAVSGHYLYQTTPTNVLIRGRVGEVMAVTIAGGWAFVTYSTQQVSTPTFVVRMPLTVEANTNQTNIASSLVRGMSDSSTNSFSTNAVATTHFLTKGASALQTVTAPVSLQQLTNSTNKGTITGGTYTNAALDNPTSTNLVNRGNAIRSEGSGGNSLQVGSNAVALGSRSVAMGNSSIATNADTIAIGTSARATNDNSTAVGNSSQAVGNNSSAYGYNSVATGADTAALGNGASALGASVTAVGSGASGNSYQATALGNTAEANAIGAIALGAGAIAGHSNSVALGTSSATTTTNQVRLGSSTTLSVPFAAELANARNLNAVGTNLFHGVVAYDTELTVSSVAAGHNVIDSSTNTVLYLTGSPGAAWTLGGFTGAKNDGRILKVFNQTGFDVTIFNESGTAPTASDRILTYAGAGGVTNVLVTGNGYMEFSYSTAVNRWLLVAPSVDVTAVATNSVANVDGSATNLNTYASAGNKVPLTVNGFIGAGTNHFQVLNSNGVPVLSVRSNGTTVHSNITITPFGPEIGVPHRLVTFTNEVTVTNTTSETSLISGVGWGTYTIPANYLSPAMTVQFKFWGKLNTDGAVPNHVLSLKLGSTVIATNLGTFTVNLSNDSWQFDGAFTCRLTGASGSVKAQGQFATSAALGGLSTSRTLKMGITYDAVTIDTTAAQTIDFTLAPGDAQTGITTTGGFIMVIP